MKRFLDENFLLKTATSQRLYHEVAKVQPICDYHCHLDVKEIYENKRYKNITEVWLYGDHYKWRFMRFMGVDEKYCTGDASDYDKFLAYAKCLQYAVGNPLYHWSHLELQRFFGIYDFLTEKTAPAIWERVNKIITSDGFCARNLIQKSNVAFIGTTDDPIDSLEYHIKLKEDTTFKTKVVPTFRPDNAVNIEKDSFADYIKKLGSVCNVEISTVSDLCNALESRIEFFHSVGSRISDHGVTYFPFAEASYDEVNAIFQKALSGGQLSDVEEEQYKTYLILWCGREYAKRGWVMQLHMNALRNNNTRMFNALGADKGFDSINDYQLARPLSKFMDKLAIEDNLPKTILYSLNPNDDAMLASMAGNFQSSEAKGKVQFGSAWWFNDQLSGMQQQMRTLANMGSLASFIGMLTDSRSFLSYPRHEYFRRILCNMLGDWVENGEFNDNEAILRKIVEDICFKNAENYFGL